MHQDVFETEASGRRVEATPPVFVFDIFGTLHQVAMVPPADPSGSPAAATERAPRAAWWRGGWRLARSL